MTTGIYTITHSPSGTTYVGSSVNIERRWRDHRNDLAEKRHRCSHLQRAWLKHGGDQFVFEIVEETTKEQLLPREQSWMDKLLPTGLYNTCRVAGSPLGMKLTAEQKTKISVALTGKPKTPEHCAALSEAQRNRVRSAEQKAAWAMNRLGSKQTEEHKAKKNAAQRLTKAKRTAADKLETRKKNAATRGSIVTINGQTFLSLNEAEAVLGISRYRLRQALAKNIANSL